MNILRVAKLTLFFLLSQWFLIGIGVAILLSYFFPNFACRGGLIRSEYSINYGAVAVIFFLSGLTMETKTLLQTLCLWKSHVFSQVFSFLITSSIMFGIAEAIRISNNPHIDNYILVGFIVTGVTPTTVSSNVVMTREAGGNDSLSLIEVIIGNIAGSFISPFLVQMYLSDRTGFSFANPTTAMKMSDIYKEVMKNIGLSLFVPLTVGQVIKYTLPRVTSLVKKYKLGKIGSFCLILMIFSSFSTAFKEDSFKEASKESIILVVFFNILIYVFFTVLCFLLAWLPGLPSRNKMVMFFKFSKKDTVALMLCVAAKTIALGVPLINAQWENNNHIIGLVTIPLVLYQSEQIVVAKVMLPLMKKWIDEDSHSSTRSDLSDIEFGLTAAKDQIEKVEFRSDVSSSLPSQRRTSQDSPTKLAPPEGFEPIYYVKLIWSSFCLICTSLYRRGN